MVTYNASEDFLIYLFHMLLTIITYSSIVYSTQDFFHVKHHKNEYLLKDKNIPYDDYYLISIVKFVAVLW